MTSDKKLNKLYCMLFVILWCGNTVTKIKKTIPLLAVGMMMSNYQSKVELLELKPLNI